jgi:hypothetical protein
LQTRNQMLPHLLQRHLLPTVAREPQQELARNSSLGLAHQTPTVLRRAVGSTVGSARAQSLRRKEMEGVGLGMRSLMMTRPGHFKDGGWEGEERRTCELLGKMKET